MWYDSLFDELLKNENEKNAVSMENYMKNKFKFLGISKKKLDEIAKPYLKESKKYPFNFNFVLMCFDKEYREAQYVGIDYLKQNTKYLTDKDFNNLKKLVLNKPWWDSVDELDSIIGDVILRYRNLEIEMINWSISFNTWLRRVSINYQQRYKNQTNVIFLEKIILNNLKTNEFFIDKAIGSSLREYSKTNPLWVKEFILKNQNKLSKLSIREAIRYLKR